MRISSSVEVALSYVLFNIGSAGEGISLSLSLKALGDVLVLAFHVHGVS